MKHAVNGFVLDHLLEWIYYRHSSMLLLLLLLLSLLNAEEKYVQT